MTLWIIIAVVVILILVIVGIYNNLVNLRNRVKNAEAQIDTQLKRRFDLIPNLVETIKGYMVHEENTLKEVVEARNKFTSAYSLSNKAEANNALTSTLKSVFALAEAYPDLKANESFINLQKELSSVEDKIAYSRQFYNDIVERYNTAIMSFPTNTIAGMFGFKEATFFEIAEQEKENVQVKF